MSFRILHVSEAFGGGIVSSLFSFAKNTPEIEHHLLVSERKDEPLSKRLSDCFASITPMRGDFVGGRRDIEKRFNEIQPKFVHLHSTYAGLYGRTTNIDRSKIIYSPHGFSFHRSSDPKFLRLAYYMMEKMLSRRTGSFAGVSFDEVRSSRRFNPKCKSIFVPNVSDIAESPIRSVSDEERIVVVAMGRLHPQKDPTFLAETLRRLPQKVRGRLDVTWVGGGNAAMAAALKAQGVSVTGWKTHAEASAMLASCDLYLHFAAWEGFPMTVIEAAAMGRPIIVRAIPAFDGFDLPKSSMVHDYEDAAARLSEWVLKPHERDGSYAVVRKVRSICSANRQASALRELYGI